MTVAKRKARAPGAENSRAAAPRTRLLKGPRCTLGRSDPARGFARGARLMREGTDRPEHAGLVCVAVTGVRAPMAVLEALSRPREELPASLPDLRRIANVDQL